MSNIQVLDDFVIVEPIAQERQSDGSWKFIPRQRDAEGNTITDSGVIIPKAIREAYQKEAQIGAVLYTGPDVQNVSEGDIILYGKYASRETEYCGNYWHTVQEGEGEIFAILVKAKEDA